LLLKSVLESAFAVARAGDTLDPPDPAPAPLRQFLGFAKLPPRALDVAHRVLDDDDEFRARVAAATPADLVTEAGRLFLYRPAGWRALYDGLIADHTNTFVAKGEARDERRATKQLEVTKGVLSRLMEETEEVQRALADEANRARVLDERVTAMAEEAGRSREERAAAVAQLKLVEARDAARVDELRQLRERLAFTEAERDAAVAAASLPAAGSVVETVAPLSASPAAPPVERLPHGTGEGGAPVTEPAIGATAAAPSPDHVDLGKVGHIVGRAAGAAAALARSLDELRRELEGSPSPRANPASPLGAPRPRQAGESGAQLSDGPAAGRSTDLPPQPISLSVERHRAPTPPRRRPSRLPGGVFDDAPEAVGALLRLSDMQVLVDGYNLSIAGWPDLDLELKRSRLLDVLSGLEASTGATFHVVFDGAEAGFGLPSESRLRSVQVRFTEPGVEADDVVLDLVSNLPIELPCTVVSSDHRVRDGARQRGANVVSSEQFLGFAR